MGFYRQKKNGKPFGPWIVKYPKERNNETGKIIYTTCRAGHYRWKAQEIFHEKMAEWRRKCRSDPEPKKEYSFGELVEWYRSLPGTIRVKSFKKIQQHCAKLKEEFGGIKTGEIKPSMIEAYQEKRLSTLNRRGTPFKPASVNRELEVMRRIFNLAVREEMAERNPCWKVTRLSERNARDRVLSMEELGRLLSELPRHAADIVTVGYFTGMRAGEIFGLTWDRVNLQEGCFVLTPEDTKTGEARHVYFNGPVRDVLERLRKVRHLAHKHVFTYRGTPVQSLKTALTKALKAAQIEDFRFHDLRHTFVSNARKAGVDRTVIMKLTGHKTLSMFTRYNTVDSCEGKEAMRRLASYFGRDGIETASGLLQEIEKGLEEKI